MSESEATCEHRIGERAERLCGAPATKRLRVTVIDSDQPEFTKYYCDLHGEMAQQAVEWVAKTAGRSWAVSSDLQPAEAP